MKITDGKRTVEIEMRKWDGTQYGPDWSNDFFEVGLLPYDEEKDAYIVKDVDYCIDQANDCKEGIGDFLDAGPEDYEIFITEM